MCQISTQRKEPIAIFPLKPTTVGWMQPVSVLCFIVKHCLKLWCQVLNHASGPGEDELPTVVAPAPTPQGEKEDVTRPGGVNEAMKTQNESTHTTHPIHKFNLNIDDWLVVSKISYFPQCLRHDTCWYIHMFHRDYSHQLDEHMEPQSLDHMRQAAVTWGHESSSPQFWIAIHLAVYPYPRWRRAIGVGQAKYLEASILGCSKTPISNITCLPWAKVHQVL